MSYAGSGLVGTFDMSAFAGRDAGRMSSRFICDVSRRDGMTKALFGLRFRGVSICTSIGVGD